MITEIITTGTELLLGEIDNENSRYLAEIGRASCRERV